MAPLILKLNINDHDIITSIHRASDKMRKKFKDYAEIFGHIMRKHELIMRKLQQIMRKFKQFIELIINPVQCI